MERLVQLLLARARFLTQAVGLSAKANSPDINPTLALPQSRSAWCQTVAYGGGSNLNGAGPRYVDYNRNYTWGDSLTWIHGRHTAKFGYTVNHYNKTENANSGQGTFTFSSTGVPTGTTAFQQSFANFLLGSVTSYSQPSQDIPPDVWAWQHEAYAQDDFKVSPRLSRYIWAFAGRCSGQPIDTNGELTNLRS